MKTRKQLEKSDDRIFASIIIGVLMVAVGYAGTADATDKPEMGERVIRLQTTERASWLPRLTRALKKRGFKIVDDGARYTLVVYSLRSGMEPIAGGCKFEDHAATHVTAEVIDTATAKTLTDQLTASRNQSCAMVTDEITYGIADMVADAWSKN